MSIIFLTTLLINGNPYGVGYVFFDITAIERKPLRGNL